MIHVSRWLLLFLASLAFAQTGDNVLLVVNRNAPVSRDVADYYRSRRSVPSGNICYIATTIQEEISWQIYEEQIERPIAGCLRKDGLQEKILYIVTTLGVPLKVSGASYGLTAEYASVDSELTLLYAKLRGETFSRAGPVANPFFGKRNEPFRHPAFPIYLVTRLAAWDYDDVKAMIDRSLAARNRGNFVIDLSTIQKNEKGDGWLRAAAAMLPPDRVVLDETPKVLYGQKNVIGYASWGSNDGHRQQRWVGFEWLPGAIVTDFVSTNGRSLRKPPDDWTLATPFEGWQQNLTSDYIHEGATGAAANVYEPFLEMIARPDYLFPAWISGRNLAESFYLSLPALSWQAIVLGDPLCSLGKPQP